MVLQSVAVFQVPLQNGNPNPVYNNQKENQNILNTASLIAFGIVIICLVLCLEKNV